MYRIKARISPHPFKSPLPSLPTPKISFTRLSLDYLPLSSLLDRQKARTLPYRLLQIPETLTDRPVCCLAKVGKQRLSVRIGSKRRAVMEEEVGVSPWSYS